MALGSHVLNSTWVPCISRVQGLLKKKYIITCCVTAHFDETAGIVDTNDTFSVLGQASIALDLYHF